jgi:hypothetical protein
MNEDAQFAAAHRALDRAVGRIERAVADLLDTTSLLDHVAEDYVIETLLKLLIGRHPKTLDYLNKQHGEASMRLANALMDWRDMWDKR